ncbi:MAG TPA: tripartite tricarboxylate transporter substrate binding protein [Burkholderiaceae bacterium]|nr:tripartite tricarboxylate transporter substrate binding protein [Burkholderiaceae bacterium]
MRATLMDRGRRPWLGAIGALCAWPGVDTRAEEPYPNRPLRLVPFGTAGGPIDSIARAYGEAIKQRFGQPVIVDAKPGASGIVAADFVAKAPPDGYTLMLTLSLTHTTVPLLQQKVPYDPVRDFQPLTKIATGGPMFVVPANAPPSDLKEFVAWAKAKGRVTYGTWGNGSAAHLFGELLKRQTGAPLEHVPYKGEAAAHLDMFGGVLDAAWANPATARTHLQAGKIKVLGIVGSRRVGTLPSVPTFTEQGFEGFGLDSWMGFFAPARTPAPVLDKLVPALREITQSTDVRTKLLDMGFEPAGSTPDEFASALKTEFPVWAALVKAAGVTPE